MNRSEQIGRLSKRISIQRATTTVDAYAHPTEVWETTASCWAEVSYPVTGSGEQQYDAVHLATTSVVFTIHWRDDIRHTDRILYNGETYDITRIAETSGPAPSARRVADRTFLAITTEKRK